jgi:putative ABC transport system permease protein
LPRAKYGNAPDKQREFFDRLIDRLRALPGIEAIGGVAPLPFSGNDRTSSFWIPERPDPGRGNHPDASHLTVMDDYFRTLRIPVLSGRNFAAHDNKDSVPVVMVNEAFVKKFFEGGNPLGQHIIVEQADRTKERPAEIIGVVGNTRHESLAIEPMPEFYLPFIQEPDRRLNVVLRTAAEKLAGLDQSVRGAVHEIDDDIYVPQLEPLEKLVGVTLAQPRFNMMLLGAFAAIAMLLAAIGIYGVIAYTVAQRTREFGIRMALGAQRRDMLQMVLRQSFSVVAIGLVIGLFSALALTRLMASLLYGVSAHDFSIYALVLFVLSAAALLASYLPARRAMNVDPMVALRYE